MRIAPTPRDRAGFEAAPARTATTSLPPDLDRRVPRTADDAAIAAAVLAGDRNAFRLLVERESPAVVRACQRILGNRQDAEDAAQEAFVTAFRALPSWRGDGPLGAWVTRIAVRIALRQAARRKPVVWLEPPGAHGHGPRPATDISYEPPAGPSFDPALEALRSERSVTIRAAVAALDEPYRETVALRFFGERSLDEIATVTGRPLGTVKTHLHRGLRRLRDRLGEGDHR